MGDESLVSAQGDRNFPPLGKLPRNGRSRVYPPEFEGAFHALPARHVAHPKADAYRAWRSRVWVHDVEEVFQLEAAADAYAEDARARGIEGTEYVMQASTFFGPGARHEPYLGRQPGSVAPPTRNGTRPSDRDPLMLTTAELREMENRR